MTDISKFFTALSERAYKENDLSDVTYAMCEADPVFKQFFLDFFFEDQELKAEDCSITREVAYPDGARPDLVVREKNGGVYFVEVKIWDGNHHFAQYASTLEKYGRVENGSVCDHFGYVANYNVVASGNDTAVCEGMRKKGRVKTWAEFAKALEDGHALGGDVVNGYKGYLEHVTRGMTVDSNWKFDLDDFEKIGKMDLMLHESINSLDIGKEYQTSSAYNPLYRKGFYLDGVKVDDCSQCPFIGTYFGDISKPVFCVGFERAEKWGDVVCDKYKRDELLRTFAEMESEGVFFYPSIPSDVDSAKEIIRAISNVCSGKKTNLIIHVDQNCGGIPPYRSIRNLTLAIMKIFQDYGLKYYPHADSHKKRYLHYGEWCVLQADKSTRNDRLLFMWFGVRYDTNDRRAKLVCEIRTERGWNENWKGNGWSKTSDEAGWNLVAKSAAENTTLEAFIEGVIKEVQNDCTSL